MWFTSIKGFPSAILNDLAKEVPTSNDPSRPGPRVKAIASILSKVIPALFIASLITGTIFCMCALLANSGTTPPYISCIFCVEITLERICVFKDTAADVSSHEDSMPKI